MKSNPLFTARSLSEASSFSGTSPSDGKNLVSFMSTVLRRFPPSPALPTGGREPEEEEEVPVRGKEPEEEEEVRR